MEKISDFFSELKERISNPFILSFLISWCCWNYKILVGLFMYKITELGIDGYCSYLDLIKHESNWCLGLVYPLLCAIVYTIGYPILKKEILIWGAKNERWGESKILEITDSPSVSYDELVVELKRNKELGKKITNYRKDEAKVLKENVDLRSENDDMKIKLSDAERNLSTKVTEAITRSTDKITELNNENNQISLRYQVTVDELNLWKKYNSKEFLVGRYKEAVADLGVNSNKSYVFNSIPPGVSLTIYEGGDGMENRPKETSYGVESITSNLEKLTVVFTYYTPDSAQKKIIAWYLDMPNENRDLFGISSTGEVINLRFIP